MPLPHAPERTPALGPEIDLEDLTKKIEHRLFRSMRLALMRGEAVDLVGLGRLEVRARKSRHLIHPTSGQAVELAQGHAVFFRPDRSLVKHLSEQTQGKT